jgi:hypothetical protein
LSAGAPFVTAIDTGEVFPIGAPFTAAYCGTWSGQTCVSNPVTPPPMFWTVGAPLPPDGFFRARSVPLGAGRYSTRVYVGAGVQFPAIAYTAPLHEAGSYEGQIVDGHAPLNACYPERLEDGRLHCLGGVPRTVVFLDAACTQPAALEFTTFASFDVTQESYPESCAFDAPHKVYTVGADVSAQPVPTYVMLPATGKCSASSPMRVRPLGPALDPSSLPELSLVQE